MKKISTFMNRRRFLQLSAVSTASAWASACSLTVPFLRERQEKTELKPPNIVFIMADDMGYGDPGCYNSESKTPTPNIDRLAAQGVRFTDAHAPGATCIPSRYGLLTGRYPFRMKKDMNQSRINPGRITLGSVLQRNGYHTACVGKWHLGFEGGARDRDFSQPMRGGPLDRGFDYFFGIHGSLDSSPYYYIENDRCIEPPTGEIKTNHSPEGPGFQGKFWRGGKIAPKFKHDETLGLFTEKALGFIEKHKRTKGDQPFFLYLPLAAPHTPWLPTGQFRGSAVAGDYGDFVAQVDDSVGQVIDLLDTLDLHENTLVFFTSDNGPVWLSADVKRYRHRSSGALRGVKGDAWEGGHRMPFIARWPGRIKPSTTSDEMICFTDMLATFAAIVDDELPADAGEDSHNILPALLGERTKRPIRETLVINNNVIRRGEWKLVIGPRAGGISNFDKGLEREPQADGALYNLKRDLGERVNLYGECPEIVADLQNLLAKFKKDGRSAPLP